MISFSQYLPKVGTILAKAFTEADNKTPDLFRPIILIVFVLAIAIAYHMVFVQNSTNFTFMDFCGGMAALITASAALFALKKESPILPEGGNDGN